MKKDKIDLKQVEKLAAQGLTKKEICDALGIAETTLYAWSRVNSQFSQSIKKGQAQALITVTDKLFDAVKDGQAWAICFYLKTRGGWRETAPETPPDERMQVKVEFVEAGRGKDEQ